MAIHGALAARKKSPLPLSTTASAPTTTTTTTSTTLTTLVRNKKQRPTCYHLLAIQLDLSRLQSFLLHTVPRYCPDDAALIQAANETYHSIRAKVTMGGCNNSLGNIAGPHGGCRRRSSLPTRTASITIMDNFVSRHDEYTECFNELNDCVAILSTFLNSCHKPILPQTLAETHHLLGCINGTMQQPQQAKQSYTSALWIISANASYGSIPTELFATTLHCLGRTYGVLDQHREALHLLYKAQQQYETLNVHKDHAIRLNLRNLIHNNRQQILEIDTAEMNHQKDTFGSSTSSTLSISLSMILEEDTD